MRGYHIKKGRGAAFKEHQLDILKIKKNYDN